jgi:serine/threonine-protein kinase
LGTVEPGTIIEGKYRVLRRIGEGGMGTVFEGENFRIERRVAIKVLHEHVASSPEFAQRFEREARACARVGSPHVCDVLDLGDLDNGQKYLVMEFLEGESLEERLTKKGRLTTHELAPIAFEILEGLGSMHQAGVIHRDLKPANVFLARRAGKRVETVKILDFGVAKMTTRADDPNQMTSTGVMMGTPLYMSPEQARGARDVDGRTDLYAASVIFYRALTGEMPHTAINLHELLFKIVLEEPRPIRELRPEVDEAFAAIVTKGLARDAEQRYASAREYQEAIAEWGRAQGRASLHFVVTLPSDPPPLRNISGGFPAAAIAQAGSLAGPKAPMEQSGPSTPAVAKTQVSSTREPAVPAARQSGGTPVVWSEDAPEIAKKALEELEARKARTRAGMTEVFPKPEKATPSEDHAEEKAPVAAPRQPRKRAAVAAGVVVFACAAAIAGARLAAEPPSGRASAGSATVTPEPSSAAEDPAPAVTPSGEPVVPVETPPPASASADPPPQASSLAPATSATAAPTVTASVTVSRPPAPVQPAPRPTTKPAASASASAASSVTPVPTVSPAPATTPGGRKFRTTLD